MFRIATRWIPENARPLSNRLSKREFLSGYPFYTILGIESTGADDMTCCNRIQMFIGESGSWIFVFGFYVYRRYIAPRLSNGASPLLAGGYNPVDTDDRYDDEDNTVDNVDGASRLPKPSDVDEEGRVKLKGTKIFLLAAPACCDIAGTTLMNVGLLFVAASIYQMTRGALVLFVGLFSVLFLRRKLYLYQWTALVVVVLGVALVGLSGALFGDDAHDVPQEDATAAVSHALMQARAVAQTPETVKAVIGVLLIATAQIFTASQFVLEEWVLENYAMDPLEVVGWEGIFGFSVTVVASIILYLAVGSTPAGRYGYFDAKEGWHEVFSNRNVALSSLFIMLSILYVPLTTEYYKDPKLTIFLHSGFNFFGLSVTRTVSATSRSTIDTCRTLFIWLVSLGLGWESFKWLQVAGFALLVYGTFLFNDIVRPPLKACLPRNVSDRQALVLPEEPIEHA